MWYFVKDAWIIDVNKDGHRDIITRKMEWWEDDDEEAEIDFTSSFADTIQGYIGGEEHTIDNVKMLISTGDDYKLTNIAIDKTKYKVLDWYESNAMPIQLSFRCVRSTDNENSVLLPVPYQG